MNTLRMGALAARSLPRDIVNRARYGRNAPRVSQRVWIDPRRCEVALRQGVELSSSGKVVVGDWDRDVVPVEEVPHLRMCVLRWQDGIPWERTGAYEELLRAMEEGGGTHAGCASREDVVRRYERLDVMFTRVADAGRLHTRRELSAWNWRERGGIYVHVGRHGQPIFNGWGGCHRLAMARILELPRIPAQLGMTHPDGLEHLAAMSREHPDDRRSPGPTRRVR